MPFGTSFLESMKKNDKIIKYPKSLSINLGVIIFLAVLIYLIFNVYDYLNQKHISYYEVTDGTIKVRTTYTGLALRDENPVNSDKSGYITYFLKDHSKAAYGTLICSIDEKGSVSDKIKSVSNNQINLDNDTLTDLAEKIHEFSVNSSDTQFINCYRFKEDLNSSIMEAVNLSALNSISSYTSNIINESVFHKKYALKPFIVSYSSDGYENATVDNLTLELLSGNGYQKNIYKTREYVNSGEPLYNMINSEKWQIAAVIDEDLKSLIKDSNVLRIKFKSDDSYAWANSEIINVDGKPVLILTLTNSMIRYLTDRFLDFEIVLSDEKGLKIPNSAIVQKDFFVVEKSFFYNGGNSNKLGLLVSALNEDGTFEDPVFVDCNRYYSNDKCYYINDKRIPKGSKIIDCTNPSITKTVGEVASLDGVYCINKGYTVFKLIEKIYSNSEYTIIEKHTSFGISMYDHIALEANKLTEDEIIH